MDAEGPTKIKPSSALFDEARSSPEPCVDGGEVPSNDSNDDAEPESMCHVEANEALEGAQERKTTLSSSSSFAVNKSTPTEDDSSRGKPMSKNQLKKRKRYEKAMAIKKRRKQQQKEARIAKAIADGRDLEEERRLQEERTKSGEGRQRREAFIQKRMKKADNSFQVCIDCSFSEHMTSKEIGSLSSQIRYSYAMNKKSPNPCYLSVANLAGPTYDNLTKVAGFPDLWRERNFACSDKSITEMHPDKTKLVYLTADSDNVVERLDDTKIYIIGGIVDRNRLKGVTMAKAKEMGIQTAKLPISEHLKLFATKVLTCNHVFEILLKCREHNYDWKKAMMEVLPKRKDAEVIEPDKPSGDDPKG